MKSNFKTLISVLFMSLAALVILPVTVAADLKGDADGGVGQVTGGGSNGLSIENIFGSIVNILSIVAGAIAVIVIIYSGMKYIASGGDANKVGSAKNALIYALIGLAVAALAEFMVHFVLHNVSY